jgi:hypothetical protein
VFRKVLKLYDAAVETFIIDLSTAPEPHYSSLRKSIDWSDREGWWTSEAANLRGPSLLTRKLLPSLLCRPAPTPSRRFAALPHDHLLLDRLDIAVPVETDAQ